MKKNTTTQAININSLPGSLWGLAFTELWERFSFYGLNGILTLYLIYGLNEGGLEIPKAAAAGIVGAYGGAVYLSQVMGAWLGERVLSPKKLVFWGGLVITFGHLALAFIPGINGVASGLILLIIGTGVLKINISNIVGMVLDGDNQGKRDVGFAYFYVAINLGAVIGPLATGFAQNAWGFHWGFGLAAIGMIVALIQYIFSMRKLPQKSNVVPRPIQPRKLFTIIIASVILAIIIGLLISTGVISPTSLSLISTVGSLLIAAAYFIVMFSVKSVTKIEKKRVLAYLPLFVVAGIYFGLLFQQFTAITFLITERVNLTIGDWSVPVPWITMLSQLAAVAITPVVAHYWGRSGNDGPAAPTKFSIALIQMGFAYVLMLLTLWLFPGLDGVKIPLLIIILVMLIAGSSETFIAPIGLSMATKIGPQSFKTQFIGLHALTLALGSSFSGLLGQLFESISEISYFTVISSMSIILGILVWVFRMPLKNGLKSGL